MNARYPNAREIESEVTYPLEVIPDFLFLSVKRNSETEEALKDLQIFAKVFLYSEETVRVDDAKKIHYAFPLETSKNSDMFNYLNDCCEFLKMNKNRVHRVLIVADKNLSRGPTLAMAYLIKEGNMTLKEAWAYMKNVYLAMRPNWHCLEQLALFEKTVKGLPEATPIVDEDFK
ncbi:Serine/threonine/tyrosine-interacting-like protein 1 [Sparganum proliferum]